MSDTTSTTLPGESSPSDLPPPKPPPNNSSSYRPPPPGYGRAASARSAKVLTIRCDDRMHDEVRDAAKARGLSANALALKFIADGLRRLRPPEEVKWFQ